MGEIAARLADVVIVTDDNPRTENPAAIRAADPRWPRPARAEIGDRARGDPRARSRRLARRRAGGRRQGPRDGPDRRRQDIAVLAITTSARAALEGAAGMTSRSGPSDEIAAATGGSAPGALPAASPASPSTPARFEPGDLFFASGRRRDGHDFVARGPRGRRGCAVVAADRRAAMPAGAPCWSWRRAGGAERARRAPRARAPQAKIVARHRLGRQDRHQGVLRARARRWRRAHASAASYNNHWGVPLTLARMPARRALRRVRDRHEPRRRDRAADPAGAPARRVVTTVEPVHLEFFAVGRGDRRRQGGDLRRASSPAERRSSTATIRISSGCRRAPKRPASRDRHLRRAMRRRDARLLEVALQADGSTVQARILGSDIDLPLGAPGRHVAQNSLAVLAR